ncbi:26S proteasome non-ATPase regulatory subunit 2 [Gaertneriomyces sp. JEL0708]|nr:26S proteasome non-ATPase regulatory subunit 2 [Gaertneriomyces sp. JEL0708]
MPKEPVAQTIAVPAEDPEHKEKKDPEELKAVGSVDKDNEEDLSEEDRQLKEELELLLERLKEDKSDLHRPALEALRTSIRTATSSMTAVPKPLKFLGPHYQSLIDIYSSWVESDNKRFLADILSVLSMTYGEDGKRDSLKYRYVGSSEPAGSWGHEYVRHLAGELIAEYTAQTEVDGDTENTLKQAIEIVPFFLKHNAEPDAVDLMLELEALDQLPQFVDKDNYQRVCLYLTSCVNYVAPPDDVSCLRAAHTIYRAQNQYAQALLISLRMRNTELIESDFNDCPDPLIKKQLAYMLARQQVMIETSDEEIQDILNNSKLSEYFLALARDLDVMEPKTPEDIYKSHLEHTRGGFGSTNVDSAKQNLASTFVNAFVNAGFGSDKLMTASEDGNWIYKNKEHGMMSATASLGAILLWDVEIGLTQIDKYLYSQEDHIKAGALLAIGIVNSGVRNESDPALALLSEYLESKTQSLKIAAIMGLGFAYSGSGREDITELLLPIATDPGTSMEIVSLASLALGMINVGRMPGEVISQTVNSMLMDRQESDWKDPYAIFYGLGMAFLHLGVQSDSEATTQVMDVADQSQNPLAKCFGVLIDAIAYAGTGNVLAIQRMLRYCTDHLEESEARFQGFAVLGIAVIAMGEEIGSAMAMKSLDHLMHYGEAPIRRAVPLALGLLCASNPLVNVLDVLSKYSHDSDQDVSLNAIFAMGLVGCGTNNARLGQMLRQLAAYYAKEPNHLFVVRVAQGMVHMGKGTVSVSPFHSERFLMSPTGVVGLMTVLVAFMDSKNLVLNRAHYLLYTLLISSYPRFFFTLSPELQPFPTTVRVGQAVDTVGQAGKPKTITGFQTHMTPVLLAYSERAELATEEWKTLSAVNEGVVVCRRNEAWEGEEGEK